MTRRRVVLTGNSGWTTRAVEEDKIVVRKLPDSGGRVRTGTLLAQRGSSLTVRWDDDGSEEEVGLDRTTTFAQRGSLRH
jgi:hypothetical protein